MAFPSSQLSRLVGLIVRIVLAFGTDTPSLYSLFHLFHDAVQICFVPVNLCQRKAHDCRRHPMVRLGKGVKYVPADQSNRVAFLAPSRIAAYFDSLGLDLGCQLCQEWCHGALCKRCRDDDSVRAFTLRIYQSGDDQRLQPIK
jgi:hypothetical protein